MVSHQESSSHWVGDSPPLSQVQGSQMRTVKCLLGSPLPRPPMDPHPQWHAAHTTGGHLCPGDPSSPQGRERTNVLLTLWVTSPACTPLCPSCSYRPCPGPLGHMIPAGLDDKKHLPPQLLRVGMGCSRMNADCESAQKVESG